MRAVKQAELFRPQVAGNPHSHEQPHAHAQDLVEKQPAWVINDLDQIGPMRDAVMNEAGDEVHSWITQSISLYCAGGMVLERPTSPVPAMVILMGLRSLLRV